MSVEGLTHSLSHAYIPRENFVCIHVRRKDSCTCAPVELASREQSHLSGPSCCARFNRLYIPHQHAVNPHSNHSLKIPDPDQQQATCALLTSRPSRKAHNSAGTEMRVSTFKRHHAVNMRRCRTMLFNVSSHNVGPLADSGRACHDWSGSSTCMTASPSFANGQRVSRIRRPWRYFRCLSDLHLQFHQGCQAVK